MHLAIHAGAGFHSHRNEKSYQKLIINVLKKTKLLLDNGCKAEDAVEVALIMLGETELIQNQIH
jgi:taspase (threonine aspartase 1)